MRGLNQTSLLVLVSTAAFGADWSPKKAAEYLDGRQKEWFAWPRAASADGPCVSCHTGLTYLLARPALRRVLGEEQPTAYETGLLNRLRTKAGRKPAGRLQGVESVFTALFLAREDLGKPLPEPTHRAFDQLWALQTQEGNIPWYDAGLDPWETSPASFYGNALAVLAIGNTPSVYREDPAVRRHIQALGDYLLNELAPQPLHNRLALLWASATLPGILPDDKKRKLIAEVLEKRQADGGWSLESLGPWAAHAGAPVTAGSNSYATGFTANALVQADKSLSRSALAQTWEWLKSHQDSESGAWPAASMNNRYPPGSMEEHFMQDAATAFAVLALIGAGQ